MTDLDTHMAQAAIALDGLRRARRRDRDHARLDFLDGLRRDTAALLDDTTAPYTDAALADHRAITALERQLADCVAETGQLREAAAELHGQLGDTKTAYTNCRADHVAAEASLAEARERIASLEDDLTDAMGKLTDAHVCEPLPQRVRPATAADEPAPPLIRPTRLTAQPPPRAAAPARAKRTAPAADDGKGRPRTGRPGGSQARDGGA